MCLPDRGKNKMYSNIPAGWIMSEVEPGNNVLSLNSSDISGFLSDDLASHSGTNKSLKNQLDS